MIEPEIDSPRDIIVLPECVQEWEARGFRVMERATEDPDRAYEERQHAIRAEELAEDDAHEQRVRENLAGEAWDRAQADHV
jgi:hypothetical protein